MTTTLHPKAFLSHASEDKDRFVLPFAAALRARGVDAWVDKWEIKLGDSIVKKIFDDGIGKADAAILILSSISVNKPWVREELDSAFVSKVEGRLRLIPVVIENCDIPQPLRHLKRIHVPNLSNFDVQVDEIVQTLFDESVKPALGTVPAYIKSPSIKIRGLEQSDVSVLLALGKIYLSHGRGPIDRSTLEQSVAEIGITPNMVSDSLEILGDEHYVDGFHVMSGKYIMVRLTARGAETAYDALLPDFSEFERKIALQLVNSDQSQASSISEGLNIPYAVVEHVLDQLTSRGLIRSSKTMTDTIVWDISVRLKRSLSG